MRTSGLRLKSFNNTREQMGSVVRGRSRRPSNLRGAQSTQKLVLQFPYCDWRQKD
jgi:hypothetical protein